MRKIKKPKTTLKIITLKEPQVLELPLCADGAGAGAWGEGSEGAGGGVFFDGAGGGVLFFVGDGGLTAPRRNVKRWLLKLFINNTTKA